MKASIASQRYDVIIIGGGQAGLAMGYELARRNLSFVILDAGARTGDVWRKRWDSLTLFTPARYSALPGLAFPADPDHMPRKDEVADYLEQYARHMSLPIRHGENVTRLEHVSEWKGFIVHTTANSYEADQVVVATGPFHNPAVPEFGRALGAGVMQVHSSNYRNPAHLPDGDVLVVGSGNSGVQIAAELARTRRTWLSVGENLPTLPDRVLRRSVFWWLEHTGAMNVSVKSRLGRRASQREFLIGRSVQQTKREDGVRVVGRARGVEGNVVFTNDGAAIEVAAVVWATGFRQDYGWIAAPAVDEQGRALHQRGISPVRGLFFLGLPWLHTRGSALLGWVGQDAGWLASQLTR